MIQSSQLLADLQSKTTSRTTLVKKLEDDLRKRCDNEPEVDAPLKAQYETAKAKKRTALTYKAWRDEELTQIAVAWVLGCVFVRFLEDNGLVEVPKLSGPGDRLRRARDEHELFIQRQPLGTERDFLLEVFEETGRLPGMKEFFDKKHNPLWLAAPSGDACRELWLFWQKTDLATGDLLHDFTDPDWNTRFLGDLYQDLSQAARKKYALLQTPDFVEEFILDRTLTPAIETFGYREVRMIDPTCGSGHFVLGGFQRIFTIWQRENPGENPRLLAQRALDAVCGVDLNPFAVAIARFRLLLAALRVCEVKRLKDAPDFHISLAVGDSLIHGARFDSSGQPYLLERQTLFGGEEGVFKDELAHFFDTEDSAELHRILGRQYHAVVGNPPYITVKDKAVSELYRARYSSCSGRYSLSLPFMERFFDLAVKGDGAPQKPAGFTGQITSNSFMKRGFGKKLVEEYLPRWDLTHVLDTAGAYIPGHGTPTVILFGRNQAPVGSNIRTVLGIIGEPGTPDEPKMGLVWQAICQQVNLPNSESIWVTSADSPRTKFHRHPWSIGGGGASGLKEQMDEESSQSLLDLVEIKRKRPNIGFASFTGFDEAFSAAASTLRRDGIPESFLHGYITGDVVRDWIACPIELAFAPYDEQFLLAPLAPDEKWGRYLWRNRTCLRNIASFEDTRDGEGQSWWSWYRWIPERYKQPLSIAFAHVATHNHFVFECGGRVFNQHAPVIKLKPDSSDVQYFSLLGILNSSAACFWLKQVAHNKGSTVDSKGARQRTAAFEDFFEFTAAQLSHFPIPANQPTQLPTALVKYSEALQSHSPASALASSGGPGHGNLRAELESARELAAGHRCKLIAWQEELDWQVYEAFGIVESDDGVSLPEGRGMDAIPPDGIVLGQRAFEIVLARRMAADEVQTTWFVRHGSTPITEVPASWPAAYRELVERRIARIESDPNLRLIEQPEYKRRWNTEPWDDQFTKAARDWLLARLEGYFFEGGRVCELKDFDPSAQGFTAAARPHLVSANQFADVVPLDGPFMEVAEAYIGASGFSVAKLIRDLVESESVPYLPHQRYKESGLRKRHDWEQVWDLQRHEDAIDSEAGIDEPGITDVERLQRQTDAKKRKEEGLGDIPVPPKYAGADFRKNSYWKLRGKLDVPKERWISYPGAERAGDDSLVIAWAGWDHLQQAKALAEYYLDAKDNQGWSPERLKPLLAGLSDLIPWLKQWHNTPDPNLGMGLGDYFAGFLEEQCRGMGITVEQVGAARFEADPETSLTHARKVAGKKGAGRKGKAASAGLDALESDATGHWQDQEFRLLAPKRRALTDYRMLVWPELLRQMPGEMEFETFRKAYWLLSEPEEFEALGRGVFPDIPASWWRSRTEQLAKDEFLNTLKGSVTLGDVKIWKQDGERFVCWMGGSESGDFPEAVDDARIALQLASFWTEKETDAVRATLEPALVLLETR